ncbi:Methyl-CpG-binding domain-containing protein 10 [Platanthera guangdongensis]|uniref:Methyl-CpG-binding domain-containing protein 10 n=1 Tax=Platanthera guangdongensis TaxID=2320717 RepID=A0ABR2LDP0_9ASPA
MRKRKSREERNTPKQVGRAHKSLNLYQKKFTPKRSGRSKENEIVFIAPTGEEIISRKQLSQYLKSHPDSPPLHEFDWSRSGEKPRRSARISEKTKAVSPLQLELQPKRKRSSRSSSKRRTNDVTVKSAPEDEQEHEDSGIQEDSAEPKHIVDICEKNKTEDAPVASFEHKNAEKQDSEDIYYDARSDEDTSNVKQHDDGENIHQPATMFHAAEFGQQAAKPSLNIGEDVESKGVEEKIEQKNFSQPGRIEAQQHLAPTLSC